MLNFIYDKWNSTYICPLKLHLFSSPQHEVLKGSYCDHSPSVGRPASVCSHSQTSSPLKLLVRSQPNLVTSISAQGERIIVKIFWVELFPLLPWQPGTKSLKNLLLQIQWMDLKTFFTERFLNQLSIKVVQRILIRWKTWPLGEATPIFLICLI